jgi:predicted DCC family thiol-disulfide oxidoreductase YuxK
MTPLQRPVVLYMHTCPFCSWSARVVAKLDRRNRVGLLSMSHPEAQSMLEQFPIEVRYQTWYLAYPDGRLVRPPEATIALLDLLSPLAPIAWLVRRLRLQRVVGRIEKLVSAYRGELGKLVPKKGAIKRFP